MLPCSGPLQNSTGLDTWCASVDRPLLDGKCTCHADLRHASGGGKMTARARMQEESVSSGKSVTALAFAVLLCAARAASAQDYPSRPLQMIVTLGAGGIVDILARGLAQEMDPRLGQRVIVVNRPGGG